MAVVQVSYATRIQSALEGQTASSIDDDQRETRTNETAAGITFGKALSEGSSKKTVILGGGNFIGISVIDNTLIHSTTDKFYQNDELGMMIQGDVWVKAINGATHGDAATYDPVTGELEPVAGGFDIPDSRYVTSASPGGLALLRLLGPVNTAPAITSSGATITKSEAQATSTSAIITCAATDLQGGGITWSIVAGGSKFTINSSTGAVIVKSGENLLHAGSPYSFTVRATDAGGLFTEQTISVVVNAVPVITNDPPSATKSEAQSTTGSSIITCTATDPQSGAITWSIRSGNDAASFSINPTTGVVTSAGNLLHSHGDYTFTVRATDAVGLYAEQLFTITVNAAPVILNDPLTIVKSEAQAVAGSAIATVSATDPESGTITFSITAGGDKFTIDSSTGDVVVHSAVDLLHAGSPFTFTARATNEVGLHADAEFTVTVNAVPVITNSPKTASLTEATAVAGSAVITCTATDPQSGAITWSLTAGGDNFTINSSTGAVVVHSAVNLLASGSPYTFTARATDEDTLYAEAEFTITVTT